MAVVDAVDRTMFTIDRRMEFFSADELAKQIGYDPDWWAAAALLIELVCNGLDAVEGMPKDTAPPHPVIDIRVADDRLTVADNGPGIPTAVVAGSLDYTTRTTDKAFHVSPTRGRQGNALKTVWAAPWVRANDRDDGDAATVVTVDARCVLHTVSVAQDALGEVVLSHHERPSAVKTGSEFVLPWPLLPCDLSAAVDDDFYDAGDFYDPDREEDDRLGQRMRDAHTLTRAFALFNPHAEFRHTSHMAGAVPAVFGPRSPGWPKWRPTDPTPPHWYTPDRFFKLVAAEARADQGTGRDRSVREYVGTFRGLSGTTVAKEVVAAAGVTARTLVELAADRGQAVRLLAAMQGRGRAVEPKALGVIGKEAFRAGLTDLFRAQGEVRYKAVLDTDPAGVPFVLEVGFALARHHGSRRTVVCGVNWAPALRLPFDGLADLLQAEHMEAHSPVVLAVHLAYPGAVATDRGKSRYDLPGNVTYWTRCGRPSRTW